MKIISLALFLLAAAAQAHVYVLGSSYSEDAVPSALDDAPQWHIDCGRPLLYIYKYPSTPCDTTSTIWPTALFATQFNHASFQPIEGFVDGSQVTEQSDVSEISYWISQQPSAVVVIHPTWPLPDGGWEPLFHNLGPDNSVTNYSRRYYYDLIGKLQAANPGRTIVSDRSNEMLDSIYHDIQNGVAPLNDFQLMFRDAAGHMSENYGKYLQHNALRQAFGQQKGIDNAPVPVEPAIKTYLDARIAACPPRATLPDAGDSCASFGAVRDEFTLMQGTLTNQLDVLANDAGVRNPVTVALVTLPKHGTATAVPAGPGDPAVIRINYVPTASYVGTDSFLYRISSSTSQSEAGVSITVLADSDRDGVPDVQDNCVNLNNPTQLDTDNDGYGNRCDADLNNDGLVNFTDVTLFKAVFGTGNRNADLDGNGVVNFADLSIFQGLFGKSPGPSALRAPASDGSIGFTLSGTATGLLGSGIVLKEHLGEQLALTINGPFRFANALPAGSAYGVTILQQPSSTSETCTITGGSGTVGTGSRPNIVVSCQ